MDTRTYEGMFLLDPTQAAQEWDNLRKQIIGMIEKRGGTVVSAKKWAERKLAYEIKGHKRGAYFLVYFDMPPLNIATLRRDFQLSELILRSLILVHPMNFKVPEIVDSQETQTQTQTPNVEEPKKEQVSKDQPSVVEPSQPTPKKEEKTP
jgi:small subunit ribosomal protein S6